MSPASPTAAGPSARLALAERNVPRYTSYPTAPHFTADITAQDYEAWLAALAPEATLSLYLHVPFCAAMCHYCGCHTKVVRQRAPVEAYLDHLIAEIELVAARTPARKVTMIHWGGGTPSMAGPAGLRRIVRAIGAAFDLSGVREHAIELDPRQADDALIAALADIGINRASLGVQDINPAVQERIGRVQPLGQVQRVMQGLRAAGIDAINCDLMYGLPGQTLDDVRATATAIADLAPDRLALFGYAHVPWMKSHQKLIDTAALPGASERLAQAEAARALLEERGYCAIGLDHFARPHDPMTIAQKAGRLRRNFQGYTVDEADALIGFGASSIGRLPQGFVQNAPDFGGYYRALDAGSLPIVRGKAVSAEDVLRAAIIERLMCDFAVDPVAISESLGISDDFSGCFDALGELIAQGIVTVQGTHIAMTAEAQPFVRLVAAAFDTYLARAGRHSAAV